MVSLNWMFIDTTPLFPTLHYATSSEIDLPLHHQPTYPPQLTFPMPSLPISTLLLPHPLTHSSTFVHSPNTRSLPTGTPSSPYWVNNQTKYISTV